MNSLFGGSAVIAATLFSSSFLLSAKPSVAETLLSSFQRSKQEVSQTRKQDSQQDSKTPTATSVTSTVAPPADSGEPRRAGSATTAETERATGMVTIATEPAGTITAPSDSNGKPASDEATYTATAYSLGGRTANGMRVGKGLIAADPRVLPLGTRVRLNAGAYSGEYMVADTGGSVRGKRIDIWTPNTHEAHRFGRRLVKLTVLSYPVKRAATLRRHKR